MKISNKILAAALSAAMLTSMSVSAAADVVDVDENESIVAGEYVSVSKSTEITDEASLNEKLSEITLTLKATLGIGDDYTSYNGDFADNITNRLWYLSWSNENHGISVTAAEDGTVMRYRKNYYTKQTTYQSYNNFYNPKFQAHTKADAMVIAEVFLDNVLKENEGAVFTTQNYNTLSPTSVSNYYFNATLTVNGIEAPVSVSITVSADTLEVINFYRSDLGSSYYGDYPEVTSYYSESQAFKNLSTKFDHTLKYYITYDEDDTEHSNPKAELRYKFISTGTWFFDAKTGEAINRDELFDDLYYTEDDMVFDSAESTTTDSAENGAPESSYKLTEVELESIEKLKDIMGGEDISAILCERYPEFGLDNFDLISTSYTRNTETDEVTATLSFSKKVTKGSQIGMDEDVFKERSKNNVYYIRKNITANGKTGELFTYYTSYPYVSSKYSAQKTYTTDSLKIAQNFLKKNFGTEFGTSELTYTYTSDTGIYTVYNFTHTVNGYTLDQNYLSVRVNNIDGTVDTFTKCWIDNVEFESPDGIISAEKALEIYTSIYSAKHLYVTVPVAIDEQNPDFEPYIDAGNTYVLSFVEAYQLYTDTYASGVKAKDGTLLTSTASSTQKLAFTDIDDCESKEIIEKLAAYGITFGGTEFEPKTLLTQQDMLVYLLNSMGMSYSVEDLDEDYQEWLYEEAVYYGFITKDEIDPDKLMRKEDVAKAVIMPSEYNAAAALNGLFKANYADSSEITDGYLSYIAIADALDLINADENNNIDPNGLMTREDLAKVVYAFMSR